MHQKSLLGDHLCNHMYENDFQRRLQYYQWLINNQMDNPNFVRNILFSDESRFTNLGLFNHNNLRYWAIDNPTIIRESRYQERFGFNVWLGLLGTRIIGPIIFDGILTGERYLGFLQNQIENVLENLPLAIERNIIFQQDGAPPHNARMVRIY
ncbi:hypothetical protein NQ318_018174 [Aromia moschata]|uniref:Transposase n=1 Tax=Aromia moschata TaxID=1265417 RepID=A0AAV8ZG61_9CUCU|nr:hypothetical protein NQ318_018174 [Aromia moschata]